MTRDSGSIRRHRLLAVVMGAAMLVALALILLDFFGIYDLGVGPA